MKKHLKYLSSILWIAPFISFIFGYQILSYFYSPKSLKVPQLLGLSLQNAIDSLSSLNLNTRILNQKIDPDLPSGIILSQTPQANETVKAYQSIYLVVTKQPPKKQSPKLQDLNLNQIQKIAKEKNIYLKTYILSNNSPKNTCIAQSPAYGELLNNKKSMVAYISKGTEQFRIFPLLKDKSFIEVKKFLDSYNINYKFFYKNSCKLKDKTKVCTKCKVLDQRPLAGSLVNIEKPINVQLTLLCN